MDGASLRRAILLPVVCHPTVCPHPPFDQPVEDHFRFIQSIKLFSDFQAFADVFGLHFGHFNRGFRLRSRPLGRGYMGFRRPARSRLVFDLINDQFLYDLILLVWK